MNEINSEQNISKNYQTSSSLLPMRFALSIFAQENNELPITVDLDKELEIALQNFEEILEKSETQFALVLNPDNPLLHAGEIVEKVKFEQECFKQLKILFEYYFEKNQFNFPIYLPNPQETRNVLMPHLNYLLQDSHFKDEEKTLIQSAIRNLSLMTPEEIVKQNKTLWTLVIKLISWSLSPFSIIGKSAVLTSVFVSGGGFLVPTLSQVLLIGGGYSTMGVMFGKAFREVVGKKLLPKIISLIRDIQQKENEREVERQKAKKLLEISKPLTETSPEIYEEIMRLSDLIEYFSSQIRDLNKELEADIEPVFIPTGRSRVLKNTLITLFLTSLGFFPIGLFGGTVLGLGAGIARWHYGTKFTKEAEITSLAKALGMVKIPFIAVTVGLIPLQPTLILAFGQFLAVSKVFEHWIQRYLKSQTITTINHRDMKVIKLQDELRDAVNELLVIISRLVKIKVEKEKYENYTAIRANFASQGLSSRWDSQGHLAWTTAQRL